MTDQEAEVWKRISGTIPYMKNRQLHKLVRMARRELEFRHAGREAFKEQLSGGFSAMANFMAGVTWALACRAALRESKGHTPVGGKRPQSGEMWLPRELLTAVRHQVKDRGWHPITTKDWGTVRAGLEAEAAARAPMPQDYAEVRFAIQFARGDARAVIDLDSRFDKSGAV